MAVNDKGVAQCVGGQDTVHPFRHRGITMDTVGDGSGTIIRNARSETHPEHIMAYHTKYKYDNDDY